MRISDWSSDVCSSDLQIGQLGARAVRGEPIFGAQEIVERTALRVSKQRLGLCPALAADCGENLRVELFFLEIGRASCREGVCQYVWISGVAVSLQKHTI